VQGRYVIQIRPENASVAYRDFHCPGFRQNHRFEPLHPPAQRGFEIGMIRPHRVEHHQHRTVSRVEIQDSVDRFAFQSLRKRRTRPYDSSMIDSPRQTISERSPA